MEQTSTVFGAVLRQWFIFFPVLILGLGLTFLGVRSAEPVYSGSLTIAVVPTPKLTQLQRGVLGNEVLTNPFTSPELLAAVLADNLRTEPSGVVAGATLVVNTDPVRSNAFFSILVTADSSDSVVKGLVTAGNSANQRLVDIQTSAGALVDQTYQARVTSASRTVVVDYPAKNKVLVGGLFLSIAGAFILAVAVNALRTRPSATSSGKPADVAKITQSPVVSAPPTWLPRGDRKAQSRSGE